MKKISMIFAGLMLAGSVQAEEDGAAFSITTVNGRALELSFESANVTQANKTAKICATDGILNVTEAKLAMPQHGHGSTATKIVPSDEARCVNVQKINFVMKGAWEIRVKLSDGDSGAFNVVVE